MSIVRWDWNTRYVFT